MPSCLNLRQLIMVILISLKPTQHIIHLKLHPLNILLHSNKLKTLYYFLFITLLAHRLDYWWTHWAAQNERASLFHCEWQKWPQNAKKQCYIVSVCFAALLSCTLRLYIRCYHRYNARTGRRADRPYPPPALRTYIREKPNRLGLLLEAMGCSTCRVGSIF